MKKVLLSVYACEPNKGSEPGNGWNWAINLANLGYEVHCLTLRSNSPAIETYPKPDNLHFHYVQLPLKLQVIYRLSQATLYLHYVLWQWIAYKKGKTLHKKFRFDVVQHISWGSIQMGSFLYKLNAPFIFGPAGGGQKAPEAFKGYFLDHWASEVKREKVSRWLIKHNPACKNMLCNSYAVLASNNESFQLAKSIGAENCYLTIDHALPKSFFPENFIAKAPVLGTLKLLWVGRFMPRKGLLLLLDVMIELKKYQNITLTVVGDGEMMNAVIDRIRANGLESTVTLTGLVDFSRVREYYSSHDVFSFTSLRDSCPAQLTEALAFGMPVVTINLHGQAFVVNDDIGIRCMCDTPEIAIEELAKAIIYLYNNPARVTQMSTAAHEYAKKQTWPEKVSALVKQYYPV